MLVYSVISVLTVTFCFFFVFLWRFYVQVKEFAPRFVDIKKADWFWNSIHFLGQIVNTINGRLARWMIVLETSISKCEKLYYVNSLFAFFPTEIKFKSDNITFTEVSL